MTSDIAHKPKRETTITEEEVRAVTEQHFGEIATEQSTDVAEQSDLFSSETDTLFIVEQPTQSVLERVITGVREFPSKKKTQALLITESRDLYSLFEDDNIDNDDIESLMAEVLTVENKFVSDVTGRDPDARKKLVKQRL